MKLTRKKPPEELAAEKSVSKSEKPAPKKPEPKKPEPIVHAEERIGYLLQCAPGLAEVLKKELNFAGATTRDQKLFVKLQRNHDLLFLNHIKSEDGLPKLRCAEMVLRCPAYGKFKISKRQLGVMAEELKTRGPRRLVVSVAGKVFQRQDLARFMNREMSERGYEFDEDVEDEVWMFCIDETWYFGLPLFKARGGTHREERSEERGGSLPPTVGAAMAFAAMPKNDDVVLDPTCGSGTLLAEFHAYAPEAKLTGCDIDANAVKVARANLKSIAGVEIKNVDSTKLEAELEPKVSLVLANLPFGVQFGDKASNPALYKGILEACLRVADPDRAWRGIFLTSDLEAFQKAANQIPELAPIEVMFKAKIRGELATAFRVKRN